ncbi:hypothetical protein LIA75_000562 [Vibrio fluvialis]|uniref:hypothetical protein n=1 Tax=Vibrio fluvialis TaxID=676 RepID=UPI001EEA3305|nr:hypothetical protein [Vibrio fluvialis]EKO3404985.1 hypothetical protein [Vibrio fluvialis]EKO3489582.1 hypothetical protein [Vibrio fluvialis]MCG6344775.1 hypothetical protein [Vibrio fluvialis]
MKVKLLTALIVLNSQFAFADDSETNAVARQIKSQIIKVLSKQNIDTKGFCDVFIEMKHNNGKKTQIVKVSTLGDGQLCMRIKKVIKTGTKYKYQIPERFIRIHINADDL